MTDSQLSVTAPGNVLLRAGNLDLRQSAVAVLGSSLLPDGDPGAIAAYAAGDMSLRSSWLMSSTYNAAPGAAIKLAARTLLIDGAGGLTTQTQGGSGNAGAIRVAVDGPMTLLNGAVIESTSTDAGGNAGGISISAKSLGIDGADSGINSIAHNSTGSAGSVNVRVTGDLTLSNGGTIASLAFGAHNGGAVALDVGGALTMVNGASVTGGTAYSDGDAGPMSIKADSINIDGAGDFAGIDNSTYYGSGKAGAIDITVTRGLALANGGRIQSASQAGGKAGTITIKAAALDILGSPDIATAITTDSASGNSDAGAIAITADRISIARAGQISSSTHSTGAGGSVVIRTGTLTIDGSGYDGGTGIASRTADGSGNAGAVDIVATGDITLLRGGIVTSRTEGAGAAGTVTLAAGTLTIDGGTVGAGRTGIFGSARAGSSGQTGQVTVSAGDLALRNDGLLSLRNDATVTDPGSLVPTTLRVAANNLLIDHAAITAEATGNADASNIAIVATNAITLKSSSITTSAVDGNGGDIRLAGQTIRLADSLVTTSVLGATNGNGGSIRVAGNALVLQSGFIQANTLAPLARGGNIIVDTSLLLPEGGTLALGGDAVRSFHSGYAGFNVIQAAAPGGASGMLQVTTPELNLAGTLTALETPTIDFGPLARDQCRTGAGSSFTVTGSGVPPATRVGSGQ